MNPRLVLIRQIIFGFLLVVFISLLGTGVWYGSRIKKLTISNIEVIGGQTIPKEKLKNIAEEELQGSYYKLVPKRFAWTYPKKTITDRIKTIDRLKNVLVKRKSGTELVIVFEEYKPYALWCENVNSTECFFIDKTGLAFSQAPKLEGTAFIRFIQTNKTPERFTSDFNEKFLQEMSSFIQRAYDDLKLNIVQVEKINDDEVVFYISGGGKLKISLRMSTEDTLKNLATILKSPEFQHIKPGNFQYIDLRYGNKVFVNEEELPKVDVATSSNQ